MLVISLGSLGLLNWILGIVSGLGEEVMEETMTLVT